MRFRTLVGGLLSSIGLKKQIAKTLSKLNILKGLNTGDPFFDAKQFIRRSRKDLIAKFNNPNGKKILFTGPLGSQYVQPVITSLLIMALRLRGVDARVFYCDAALNACELVHASMFDKIDDFVNATKFNRCNSCKYNADSFFNGFNIPKFYFSEFYDTKIDKIIKEIENSTKNISYKQLINFNYDGVSIGEHIRTSLHRFFLAGIIEDNPFVIDVGKRYLISAIKLIEAFKSLFNKFKPDVLVTHHGIYLIGGVAVEVARKFNIRIVTWDAVYRRGAIQLSHNDTYHHEFRNEPNENWQSIILSIEEEKRLEDYLRNRRYGKIIQDSISYHRDTIRKKAEIISSLKIDTNKPIVILFPNVAWDGNVRVRSSLYDGPIQWVADTLKYLSNRDDIQVIVRMHPAEVKEKAFNLGIIKFEVELLKLLPNLPKNTIIIPSDSKINSYELAEMGDIIIVYSTLLGLELLVQGKQVIITGDAYYSNKGFGIQPKNLDEYHQILGNLPNLKKLTGEERELAKKYAYHFFFKRWIQLPEFYSTDKNSIVSNSLSDLLPGKHKDLDRACDGIINGTPFHIGA